MPQMEFEGKNVESAVEKACKKLNYSKDKIKYDILSSGSSGIFGLIGVKKAKIRVIQSIEDTKKSSGGNGQRPKSEGVKSLVDEAFNGFGSKGKTTKSKKVPSVPKQTKPAKDPEPPKEKYVYPEGPVNSGMDHLKKIVNSITDDTSITIETNSDRVVYNITGGNSALLIGKRGQTLDAIQYLIDKIVNKQSDERVRIQIDVEGYLETRKESLQNLALRLAEKARKTGKVSSGDSAYERVNQVQKHLEDYLESDKLLVTHVQLNGLKGVAGLGK